MIAVNTTVYGTRTYTVTRELLKVAKQLFPDEGDAGAVFSLARSLTAEKMATIDCLALCDPERAVQRATAWIGH